MILQMKVRNFWWAKDNIWFPLQIIPIIAYSVQDATSVFLVETMYLPQRRWAIKNSQKSARNKPTNDLNTLNIKNLYLWILNIKL